MSILTDRALSESLAPMLAASEPLRSGDLMNRAWAVVEEFLALEPNEEEYIVGIQRGEFLPQLLFTDASDDPKRIAEHPAILWKLVNVRNQLTKPSKKRKGDAIQNGVKGS